MRNYLGENSTPDLVPYQEDGTTADTVFRRWDHNAGTIYIERDTKVGEVVTREKTLHSWADRANAVYFPLYSKLGV